MKNFLVISFLMMSALAVLSQGKVIFNYVPSLSAGSTTSFIDQPSWNGNNIDFRFEINENIEVGGLIGWNYLDQQIDRSVYSTFISSGTIDVNAVQNRYLNIIPLTAQVIYSFHKEKQFLIPYGGFALGGYRVDYEKYWGENVDEFEEWSFGFAPSLGFLIPLGTSGTTSINIQARYNLVFFEYNEISNISYFDFNFGFSFDL